MNRTRLLLLLAPLLLGVIAEHAEAAPGDVVIPAHRARDGTLIPPNVPPSSGGTTMPLVAKGKAHKRTSRPTSRGRPAAAPVPMFVEARPIVR